MKIRTVLAQYDEVDSTSPDLLDVFVILYSDDVPQIIPVFFCEPDYSIS